jgi:phage-related protein
MNSNGCLHGSIAPTAGESLCGSGSRAWTWPIGMPLVRSLGSGLWEVRSSLPRGRIARVLFCVHDEQMVLLHAFIKKTQKTPKQDLDLALGRMNGDPR